MVVSSWGGGGPKYLYFIQVFRRILENIKILEHYKYTGQRRTPKEETGQMEEENKDSKKLADQSAIQGRCA